MSVVPQLETAQRLRNSSRAGGAVPWNVFKRKVAHADMRASRSFGTGNGFTSTGAARRAGNGIPCTFILTERGSTSGVHWASGARRGVGRAVSEAIGATWIFGGGSDCVAIRAARLICVGVD